MEREVAEAWNFDTADELLIAINQAVMLAKIEGHRADTGTAETIAYIEANPRWTETYIGLAKLGGFGEMTHPDDRLRWYWHGAGSFGHCPTREEAVAELMARVPEFLASLARQRAADAEFDAMPADLQKLRLAMDRAYVEQQRAWGRNPFHQADYQSASSRWYAARLAFDKARDAWASRREAA